jgi:Putative adhesin
VVDADWGNVKVGTWDKQVVQIIVKQTGPDLAQYLKHHSISITQEGKEVNVKAIGDSWLSSHDSKVKVAYEMTIPIKLEGSIKDGAGNIEMTGTGGTIDATTGAGNLDLSGIAGPMSCRSGAGNIDVSDCRDKLEARTGAGNIDIDAFAGSLIEARTGVGNIDANLVNQIKADSALHTGMGNISVTLKATMAVNLDATSGMGHVDSQFPTGTLNGGGPRLSIKSGSGNVEIEKAP